MPEFPSLDWLQGHESSDTDSWNYFLINRHSTSHIWGLKKNNWLEPLQRKAVFNFFFFLWDNTWFQRKSSLSILFILNLSQMLFGQGWFMYKKSLGSFYNLFSVLFSMSRKLQIISGKQKVWRWAQTSLKNRTVSYIPEQIPLSNRLTPIPDET